MKPRTDKKKLSKTPKWVKDKLKIKFWNLSKFNSNVMTYRTTNYSIIRRTRFSRERERQTKEKNLSIDG